METRTAIADQGPVAAAELSVRLEAGARSDADSIAAILARRARAEADRIAFHDLRNDLTPRASVTYGELDRRARATAATLSERLPAGARVLLAAPHPIDYLAGLFGCLYAGHIAVSGVPAYAPSTRTERRRARLERLAHVVRDAAVGAILGPPEIAGAMAQALAGQRPAPAPLALPVADGSSDPAGTAAPALHETAFLQYTSGSTTAPGGVVVTQANLVANLAAQADAFAVSADDVGVSWLPLSHDLGLIAGCLLPIFAGFPGVLFPAAGFAERPGRWLECLSRFGGTLSWAPNFAYRLCVKSVAAEARAGLDLSRWRVAMNAAETVQAETVKAFTQAFAVSGFRPQTLRPCYGLAEATLLVTASAAHEPPSLARFDLEALARGEAGGAEGPGAGRTGELVGCGRPVAGVGLRIVDPLALTPVPDGQIGEIWVGGPGVSPGYFARAASQRAPFLASLADTPGPWLRTGDLGVLHQGELFVTGRLKDVIILRGANHYPQDLEATAAASHPALREDHACAFPLVVDGQEALGVACEIDRRAEPEAEAAAAAIRAALFEAHGLEAHTIAIVRWGALPKTPSGKLQRRLCRERLADGGLPALWRLGTAPGGGTRQPVRPAPPSARRDALLAWVVGQVQAAAGAAPVSPGSRLADLGLSSLQITEFAALVETTFGERLAAAELYEMERVLDVAERLAAVVGL